MSSQTQDKDGPEDAILAVRLPAKLRDDFKEVAEANHRTMSGEVRFLVEERVARSKPSPNPYDAEAAA